MPCTAQKGKEESNMMDLLITISDAARDLGYSRETVRRRFLSGKLKAAVKVGKGRRTEYLFTQKEVDRLKAEERRERGK
jgi:predicted transcriptional regulator